MKNILLSCGIAGFLGASIAGAASSPAPYQIDKLSNGLEVITVESPKVPLVTIVLVAKAGAMTETPDINGLTHLWEHMFFKGNARLPDQEAFNKRVRQLGIDFNGDTGAETVRYFFTLPSAYLDEGMQFMSDAIMTPLLEQNEMERERHVVLDEYDRNASNPGFDQWDLDRHLLYGDLGYLRDPLGYRPNIEGATRDQLLRIKGEVFVPANCGIFVAGDATEAKVKALAEKYFLSWQNPKDWKRPTHKPFPPFPKTTSYVMSRPHIENASIDLVFAGPRARENPKDTFAADVMISLLNHRSGKFFKKYMDSGLTFGSGMSYHTQSDVGELHVFAESKAENAARVRDNLIKEVAAWAQPNYFTATQLEDVRRSLLIDHKKEVNATSQFIKTVGFWWSITGLDYYTSYLDNLRATSLADISAFATKYFKGKNYIASILVSPEGAKAAHLSDTSKPLMEKFAKDLPHAKP